MKNLIYAMLLVAGVPALCRAQSASDVLYVVKSPQFSKAIATSNLLINGVDTQSSEPMSKADAQKQFGTVKQSTVLVITPKANVKFITLSKLYANNGIDKTSQAFPIKVEGKMVADTSNFLIDEDAVKSVKINNNTINIKLNNN
jgi:hypothetical protein